MGGVNMRAVQRLLGHADLRMTERYSHLSEQVLAAAVQVFPALPLAPANGNGHEATAKAEKIIPAEPVPAPA